MYSTGGRSSSGTTSCNTPSMALPYPSPRRDYAELSLSNARPAQARVPQPAVSPAIALRPGLPIRLLQQPPQLSLVPRLPLRSHCLRRSKSSPVDRLSIGLILPPRLKEVPTALQRSIADPRCLLYLTGARQRRQLRPTAVYLRRIRHVQFGLISQAFRKSLPS